MQGFEMQGFEMQGFEMQATPPIHERTPWPTI